MKNFLTLIGANVPTAAVCTAKSPQNTGGGSSQSFTLRSIGTQYFTRFLGSSCRVWKYVACMLMVLCLGIGNVWGADSASSAIEATNGNKTYSVNLFTGSFTVTHPTSNITSNGLMKFTDDNAFNGVNPEFVITFGKFTNNNNNSGNTVAQVGNASGDVLGDYAYIAGTSVTSSTAGYRGLLCRNVFKKLKTITVTANEGNNKNDQHKLMVAQAVAGKDVSELTFTEVASVTGKAISLSKTFETAGDYYVAIVSYRSGSAVKWTSEVAITGFSATMEVAASCTEAPAAPSAFAKTAVTATTATFSITDAGNAASYDLYYASGTPSAPTGSTTATTNVSTKTPTIESLTGGTTYKIWVRSVCDADHKSDWVALGDGGSFTTLADPEATFNDGMYVLGGSALDLSSLFSQVGSGSVTYSITDAGETGATLAGSSFSATTAGTATVQAVLASAGGYAGATKTAKVRVVAAPTHLVENRMATGGTTWDSYILTNNAHISNLVELQAAPEMTLIKKATSSTGRTIGITSTSGASLDEDEYIYLQFTIESGYELTLSEISVPVFKIANSNGNYVARISDASNSIESNVLTLSQNGTGNPFNEYDFSSSPKLSGTVTLKLFAYGWSDGYRMESPVYIDGTVAAELDPSAYAITKSATNGTIAVTDGTDAITSADADDKVYIAATPSTGYEFASWDVYKTGETSTKVTLDTDDDEDAKTRTFDMPDYDVTVGATFSAIDYTVTHNAATNGSYTIKVGDAKATGGDTKANYGQTVTLAATPDIDYKFSAWDVYKTGEPSTKVTVTNNQFTMPDYAVSVSATFAEATELYDYSVMENKSFTDEEVNGDVSGKSKTFGIAGNPQLVVTNAGWDEKDNIINSFIKFFGGTSSMSVVIPTGRKATVTIQYGSYSTGKYLLVNGTEQTHPLKALDNSITTSNIDTYMPTVELTNQTGTLVLNSNGSGNNIYIAYVDVVLTGYASYGITYHLNDGAWDGDAGAATYTYGTGIASLASNVTKTGYDFAGWYGNEGLTGDAVTSIANNVTGDKEFWAAWTPKSYTLTWDWNGGSCSATAGDDYTAGGSVAFGTTLEYPEASTMSKENTAFAGWSSIPETMPAEALTITAQWAPSHAITYTETKGATNANPTTYVEGIGVASFEPLADVANFHFTGWSPASISNEATTVQTIEAQWVAAYNVSFNAGEGSGTVPATFQKWATASFELPGQGEMVAPEGKIFDGWKVNGAGENRAAGYEYTMTAAAVEFVAQWKAVTLLINYDGENYSLNTTDFHTGVTLQDEIVASGYPKNAKFGNTCSSVSSIDNLGKAIIYHTKTNATKVTISAYNNYTGGSTGNLYYSVVEEGATSASVTTKGMTKGSATTDYVVNMTGRSTLYIMCGHDIRICQVSVEENGTANKVAPEVGYSINLNKQRPLLLSGVATSFEGVEYKVASNFKPVNGQVQINALTNTYYKFTIPTGQTRQLQLTTSNTNKYVVSKTLGDDTEAKKISGNQNINLTEGTWYINPQGSNVNITNIAFATAPAALTVTFKDGATTLGTQNVWSGEKATALSPAPTKSGHRFVEWQLSGSAYDFDDEVTTDITLDAVWQETVTVTFAPANGEDNFTKQADKGAVLAAGDRPADPVYAGHVFQGWTRNASAEPVTYVNLASETFSADATLTAVWEVAQTDATISALSYNGNAIDVESAEDVAGVTTYTVHLQWGTTIDKDLISVTKTASTATVGTIAYDSEAKKATFTVTAGDGTTTADYAIQFVIDAKRGTSLIKATTNNVVTGLIGGTRTTNLDDGNAKKLNGNTYFGVTLANDETFQEGDVFIVNITTAADLGKFMVYADKDRTVLVADQGVVYTKPDVADPVVCPTGEMRLVLPAAANGKKSLYLSREDGTTQWNPTFSYIEVTREMNPVIKSFKFGDEAATINESAKTISIDVPYGTAVTALTPTVEAYGNNGTTYTPDGATDFTSPVDYVVKDAYNEFSTTYTVTVNVAAPSENANLASLSVAGYALDFNKATTTYNVILDYGTTALPEITYAVEDAGLANAVKVEDGVNGATTITVTPQAGAGYEKVYTINFTVSTTPKFVIYDGSTMTNIASRAFNEATSGFSYTIEDGVPVEGENATATLSGKNYTKVIKSFRPDDNPKFSIVVPDGYVAKVYMVIASNSNNSTRSFFISKTATGTKDETYGCVTSTTQTDVESGTSAYLLPDTYYFGATDGVRLYELSVTLYPAHMRNATVGKMATVCLPNNVEADGIIGAEVYELLYWKYGTSYADCQMVDFGEVTSMEEGHAYLFIPTADKVAFVLGNNVAPAPVVVRGFTGTFVPIAEAYNNVLTGKYGVVNNMIQKLGHDCYSQANRAYIDLSETPSKDAYDAQPHMTNHAPRKRVSLGHKITTEDEPIATGLDAINVENADVQKVLINGEMFIIRDGHIYSATGMMVK